MWLKYQSGSTIEEMRFPLGEAWKDTVTKRITGETQRGILYSHRVSKRPNFEIFIPAVEIAKYTRQVFLSAWWDADRAWVCPLDTESGPSPTDYIELALPEGRIPLNFLNENHNIPSFKQVIPGKMPT